MNRIQLFIDALRSGEFTQGRTRLFRRRRTPLRENDSYCCLGVACEIYHRETGKGEWVYNAPLDCEGMRFDHMDKDVDGVSFMPQPVYAWFGFPSGDPLLNHGRGVSTATEMNDKMNRNFHEIADAFERTYINNETK